MHQSVATNQSYLKIVISRFLHLAKKLQEEYSVLWKDHTTEVLGPGLTRDNRIMSFSGMTQVKVVNAAGKTKIVNISEVKKKYMYTLEME